ncbi:MAG: DPP IV N-terminal domain-containing protein, partial [candidate division WOR-3 bacterium]
MKTTGRIMKAFAAIVLIVFPLTAEQPQVSREDYVRAEQYLVWNISKLAFKIQVVPHFFGKSDRFWYRLATRGGKEFILVDPALNTKQPAFDQVRLAASLSLASGKAYEANNLPFDSIEFVKDGRAIQFNLEKDRWTLDLSTYACVKTEAPKENPEYESLSPDGEWAAYVKDYDLYIRPTAEGEDVRLTTDGEAYCDYGSEVEQSTVAVTQRLSGKKQPPVILWSPDSKKILAHRLDQRKVEPLYLLQSSPPQGFRPLLHSYRYALVGDPHLPLAELLVLDVETKTNTPLKTDPYLVLSMSPITTKRVWWGEDSRTLYFVE